MERLMAQAQWIARDGRIEFGAGRTAPLVHESLIAAERAEPVSRRGLAGGEPEVGQQIADRAAAHDVQTVGDRSPLHKVEVAIDETGGDGAPGQTNQMSLRADQRL